MLPEEQKFLEQLYREAFDRIVHYIASLLKSKGFPSEQISGLAEEIAQDTFHTASKKVSVLMEHPNPQGWLMVTAKNKFRQYKRRIEESSRWFLPSNDFLENLPDPSHNPASVLDDMGYTDAMDRIRQNLSAEDFQLFRMVLLDHASHKAAAQELGITVWASQKRLGRIRNKLQKLLSQ